MRVAAIETYSESVIVPSPSLFPRAFFIFSLFPAVARSFSL